VDEVIPAALASIGARAADVVVDVDETHPRVLADPGLLERALANVIVNALNHSPPGEPVRIVAGAAGDAVDVRVVDRGPGVPAAERDRMFMPFQRLGDAGSGEGVGLGLAVAKGFVEAIGGRMEIEDTPGGGLTMVVRLEAAR
jgi:two-component system sensor histidine kinase KdpD